MRDNAVKYNKQRAQTPLGDAPLVHVAGTGGVALWFIIKTQVLRLSDGVCWVGWRTSTAPRRVCITLDCDSSLQAGNDSIWDVENMENSQIVAFV